MMPTLDISARPSSSQPLGVGEGADKPQTASSLTTKTEQVDSLHVVHVASSPIADLKRKKVFVRSRYKDIFARIWKLMRLWIQYKKAELATSKGKTLEQDSYVGFLSTKNLIQCMSLCSCVEVRARIEQVSHHCFHVWVLSM